MSLKLAAAITEVKVKREHQKKQNRAEQELKDAANAKEKAENKELEQPLWEEMKAKGIVTGGQKKLTLAKMNVFKNGNEAAKKACNGLTKRTDILNSLLKFITPAVQQ